MSSLNFQDAVEAALPKRLKRSVRTFTGDSSVGEYPFPDSSMVTCQYDSQIARWEDVEGPVRASVNLRNEGLDHFVLAVVEALRKAQNAPNPSLYRHVFVSMGSTSLLHLENIGQDSPPRCLQVIFEETREQEASLGWIDASFDWVRRHPIIAASSAAAIVAAVSAVCWLRSRTPLSRPPLPK